MVIYCLNGRTFECNIALKSFLALAEAVTQGHAEANLIVAGETYAFNMRRVDVEKTMQMSIPDTLRPPPNGTEEHAG